jgi:hypothetical protein
MLNYLMTRKFNVSADGVIPEPLLLQTRKLAVFKVKYPHMYSDPDELGLYPVTVVGLAFGLKYKVSVVNAPVAAAVTAVAHVPELMVAVPRAAVPLATVPAPVQACNVAAAVPLDPMVWLIIPSEGVEQLLDENAIPVSCKYPDVVLDIVNESPAVVAPSKLALIGPEV